MGWAFDNIKISLEEMMFDLDDVKSCSSGRVVRSNYLPLTEDVYETNAVAVYLYGEGNVDADLIQLSASKGNKADLSETNLNLFHL
ncbi:hypothetical protein WNY79_03005 [Pseudoalteromonas sp. AS84]|uniref:hypothetical protein n=1 Tax=Pseudoalteromonas sp. AS84 TaxID=3135778 RepID=UPI0031708C81